MQIGKPTTVVPPDSRGRNDGKYAEIYRAIEKLKGDDWLPVRFATRREAYNFRIAAHTHRTLSLRAKMRGSTVYVQGKNGRPATGKGKER
jgi:hypothetical protein